MIHQSGNRLTPQDAATLKEREPKQSDIVKEFFDNHRGFNFSSEEIHARALPGCPLTSVRRCLSDLCKGGFIQKDVSTRKEGKYGISIVTWVRPLIKVVSVNQPTLFDNI